MATAKVAISLDRDLLKTVDGWVARKFYPNRSRAIQNALREKAERWKRSRLAHEAAKLNRKDEQALADESIDGEAWQEF